MTGPEEVSDPAQTGIERMLGDGLRTQKLDPARLDRIRSAVAEEWLAATAVPAHTAHAARRPVARQRWWPYAAAACMALGILSLWLERPAGPAAVIGSIARLGGAGVEVAAGASQPRRLVVGDRLRAGDRFTAPAPMLVAFAAGGTLAIATGSILSMTAPSALSLERGLIYVDVPHTGANPLRIRTTAGEIDHIGTEFEVMSDAAALRIRVREGQIRFAGNGAQAVAGKGTELLVAGQGPIATRPIATYGPDWQWTLALAPDFDIEGRPLMDFLEWISRQTGRPLEFADDRSRQIAQNTVLHGSVRGQAPTEALSRVLLTTSLVLEPQPALIRLHSTR